MIEYYKKHTQQEPFQRLKHPTEGAWVHVSQPSPAELEEIASTYELDAHILRDVLDKNELPRREHSGNHVYVFLRPAHRARSGEVVTSPLLAIAGKSMFMTISASAATTAEAIAEAGSQHSVRTSHSAGMLILVIQAVIGQYSSLVQHTDDYIRDVRHKLKSHEVKNDDFVHFVTIEDNLNEYLANLKDTENLIERLHENNHEVFGPKELELLDDVKLYAKELQSTVNRLSETITSIRNAYSTIANNTLNERMKVLTALTVLIALPNVLYGMYGMNIPLPFQDAPWAYPAVMASTVFVVLLVYTIAKRFKVF